ncbi:MAG: glutathione synthase, partial [Acidobacteria bacterium]|nr:glutathione synthase [Acidobacteriota bacterium]
MKIAFLMDPLETVKPYKDTTYFIMLGAQERGHQVYFFQNRDLYFQSQSVFAVLTELKVSADHAQPFQRLNTASTDLAEMDVIFVRTDPPFDRRYFYATLLLDLLPASTRVLNRPSALRDWNEKLSSFFYTAFTPDSLV